MRSGKMDRRSVLTGAGVLLGLPLLEAMQPLLRAAPPAAGAEGNRPFPVRFAALYMPNGVNPHLWTPKGQGKGFELSRILEPLARHRDDLIIPTNLWNAASNTGDGHYVKTGGWLTSTTITRTTGSALCSGNTSMDQLMAQRFGNLTALPSLELGIEPSSTGVDTNVGFTQLYGAHIAWATPVTPLAKEINPKLAFDRLFRSTAANRPEALGHDDSVLDLVAEDARRLQRQLGGADRRKLDEYFESVRSVEKRIQFEQRRKREEYLADPLARAEIERVGKRLDGFDPFHDPGKASERGVKHTEHVRLMLDILALSFWTDSTRVGTFMFGNSVSGKDFTFLDGVKGGFHEISHHEKTAEKLEMYLRINRWHQEQFAYFLDRLKGIREGEGTLLDHSLILCGAGMRDGNAHDPVNLPLVLAGRGGGTVSPGRHIVYPAKTPFANLHLALLRRVGVESTRFADSTEELKGLDDPTFGGVPLKG
jgi:hypothetical protein